MIRALFLEFPTDPQAWETEDQYLLGRDILVAPVAEAGARKRTVYFPGNEIWISPEDQLQYRGGSQAEIEAPLDRIPVFIRKGARVELKF